MLSIFMFGIIATTFARKAFDKDRNRFLWGFIGVASYFLMRFLTEVIIYLIDPDLFTSQVISIGVVVASGFIGVGIAYYFLQNLPDPNEKPDADLLDSEIQ